MTTKYLLKLVVAGDGGVGKTSLLLRYVENRFTEDILMTLGVQFFTKQLNIDDKNVMITFWDLGGQEHFQELHHEYVDGAMGILYLFDLNNIIGTLKNIDSWMRIFEKDPDVPKVMIGTKYDLIKAKAYREEKYEMHKKDIEDVKKLYKFIDYFETSSKAGYNIDVAVERLVKAIIE